MLFASGQDSLTTHRLKEVVVTGEVEPQSAQRSVYNVRTIPMERLSAQGVTSLQGVLNTELNIRFSQDLALGGSNLSMLGLPGQNVKVLIDGVPMVGRQGTGNEININQINIGSIDRVEIVQGPMAVIYGADALAGVINIITRKATENKLDVSAGLHEETVGREYGWTKGIHNERVNLAFRRGAFYASGNLNRNDFRGWKGDSTGREEEWHPKRQYLAGGLAGYKNEHFDVYYRLDYLNEKIYNPGQFSGKEAIDQNYITNRFMHQVQLTSTLSSQLNYNGAFSYTDYTRRTQSIAVDRQTGRETLANAALQNTDAFRGGTVRGIFQYKVNDRFSLQPGYDVNLETGSGQRLKTGSNTIGDYAAFFSANLEAAKFLGIRAGVRVVRNTAYEAPPVIPSVNTKFRLSENHDIRVSYGRGFRAPSIRELYFSFFDASHSIEGNPDLKAELSHSINASWNGTLKQTGAMKLSTVATVFYNTVKNMIDFGRKPNSNVTTYVNIDTYRSEGVSWTNTLRLRRVEMRAGFTYTGRYNKLTKSDTSLPEFTWSPEVNGSLTYSPRQDITLSMFYKYTGSTPTYVADATDGSVVLAKSSGFHWADVTVRKRLGGKLSLTAGSHNVLNTTRVSNSSPDTGSAHSGSGTTIPVGYGRSYFIALNFQITQ